MYAVDDEPDYVSVKYIPGQAMQDPFEKREDGLEPPDDWPAGWAYDSEVVKTIELNRLRTMTMTKSMAHHLRRRTSISRETRHEAHEARKRDDHAAQMSGHMFFTQDEVLDPNTGESIMREELFKRYGCSTPRDVPGPAGEAVRTAAAAVEIARMAAEAVAAQRGDSAEDNASSEDTFGEDAPPVLPLLNPLHMDPATPGTSTLLANTSEAYRTPAAQQTLSDARATPLPRWLQPGHVSPEHSRKLVSGVAALANEVQQVAELLAQHKTNVERQRSFHDEAEDEEASIMAKAILPPLGVQLNHLQRRYPISWLTAMNCIQRAVRA